MGRDVVRAFTNLRAMAEPKHRDFTDRWLSSALAAVALTGSLACKPEPSPLAKQGKDAFSGVVPLKAKMVGHETELPASVVRCQNCHQTTSPAPAPSGSAVPSTGRPADSFGPVLNRAALTEARVRRGGPPSKYDSAAFCRLLKDGVDPAHVIIPMTMPRYSLSQRECDALWEYLIHQ
jgi:hypothetical protein